MLFGWIVGNCVGFSITQIESVGFFTSERARAATAEDGDLMAALVDGAIRYAIVREQQFIEGMRKLHKSQDAAEPACQPAPAEARVSTARSAFVN